MITTILAADLGPIQTDDFPALVNPRESQPKTTRRTSGVRLDPHEEAASRFGLPPADDQHDDSTTIRTSTQTKEQTTMPTSKTTRRRSRAVMTPREATHRAWTTWRRAEIEWRRACDLYAASIRGFPGPAERTARQDRYMQTWESITDELCAKAAKARARLKRAIVAQRRAELIEVVRLSA